MPVAKPLKKRGWKSAEWSLLAAICPQPGGSNERLHLYVGEVDSNTAAGVHGLEEEGEDIRVLTPTLAQAYQWLEQGVIINAASIIALQWLKLNQARLKAQWL